MKPDLKCELTSEHQGFGQAPLFEELLGLESSPDLTRKPTIRPGSPDFPSQPTSPAPPKRDLQAVRLNQIREHPGLRTAMFMRNTLTVNLYPKYLLSHKGIEELLLDPIHVEQKDKLYYCFRGFQALQLAQDSLSADTKLEVLVYAEVDQTQICNAVSAWSLLVFRRSTPAIPSVQSGSLTLYAVSQQ